MPVGGFPMQQQQPHQLQQQPGLVMGQLQPQPQLQQQMPPQQQPIVYATPVVGSGSNGGSAKPASMGSGGMPTSSKHMPVLVPVPKHSAHSPAHPVVPSPTH